MMKPNDPIEIAFLERKVEDFREHLVKASAGHAKHIEKQPFEEKELFEFVQSYAGIRDVLRLAASYPERLKGHALTSIEIKQCVQIVDHFEPGLITLKQGGPELFNGVSFTFNSMQADQAFFSNLKPQGPSLSHR